MKKVKLFLNIDENGVRQILIIGKDFSLAFNIPEEEYRLLKNGGVKELEKQKKEIDL